MRRAFLLTLLACMAWTAPVQARSDLLEQGRGLLGGIGNRSGAGSGVGPGGGSGATGLSESVAESGLREALRVATSRTVAQVGRADGFYGDPRIRIPLPGFLETARRAMGAVGMAQTLDELELRMNRAAEAAAPQAAGIFGDAIAAMTVTDARGIVTGPRDSATRYFQRTTTQPLTDAFRPVVDRALADVGAVRAYDAAVQGLGGGFGGLGGMLGGGAAGFSFTDFVVARTLDGIFHYVGEQEAAIRTDPAARTTEILRDVFGR